MLVPNFVHGKMENVQKAIDAKKIVYPSYVWITDLQQYGFLNKNNELETIGIPVLAGTLSNIVILSDLSDGLYKINGQYKITSDSETIFSVPIDTLTIIQTIDNIKKIRVVTIDEIITYSVSDGVIEEDFVVNKSYLESQGYATIEYVSAGLEELENRLTSLNTYINEELPQEIDNKIETQIEDNVLPVDDSDVRNLFN